MNGLERRRTARELVRAAAWTAPPFVLLIGGLVLHRVGVVPRHPNIAYERTLVLDLLLYWAVAAGLLAAWRRRDSVGAWLGRRKAEMALLLVMSLLGLGAVEVALRLLRGDALAKPFERLPSAELHHVNAPSRSSLGMGGARVVTNEDGFRDVRTREEILAADHRVALLGDSFVFGLGVEADEAVGAVLERELSARLAELGRDETVAVLNTGVISYSPLLARQAYLHRIRTYRPTAVIQLLDVNDIGDDYGYEKELVGGPAAAAEGPPEDLRFDVPEPDPPSLCDASALCRALQPVRRRLLMPFTVAANVLHLNPRRYSYYDFEVVLGEGTEREVVETNRFFILRHPLETTRPFFDRSWRSIDDLAARVAADGAVFALAVAPRYVHWDDAEAPDNWESHRYAVDEPYEMEYFRYFEEASVTASFPVWSLLPFFESPASLGVEEGPLVFRHDPHWNARGHQVAGRALARLMVETSWPDPKRPPAPGEGGER